MPQIIESECNAINLGEEKHIPAHTVLLVSRDLNARARVEGAAPDGATVAVRSRLEGVARGVTLVLLDLDAGGDELVASVTELSQNSPGVRWVGFFSHVAEDLGRKATAAGIEAIPRGRFWRELPKLLRSN